MVLLIVKNDSDISKLLKCLEGISYIVHDSHKSIILPENCSGVILAGSNMHVYSLDWINNIANIQSIVQGAILAKCPILGICYGMQLIATLFGGEVTKLYKPLNGEIDVNLNPRSLIFDKHTANIKAFFRNEDIVSKVPRGFKITGWISGQRKAIAIQNKEHNIFGVQFHPESLSSTKVIIRNFLKLCTMKENKNENVNEEKSEIEKKDMKQNIINGLQQLALQEKVNKQYFKVKAYTKVINELKASSDPIYTIDDVKNVAGIGASIHEKIKAIFDNPDKIVDSEEMKVIDMLSKIHGIGATKAKQLYDKGIRTIVQLENNLDLLNDNQKIGLKYANEIDKRIPYKEMEKHKIFVTTYLKNNIWEIAGSFRRKSKDSGDIDIIVKRNASISLDLLIEKMKNDGYIKETLALGEKKFMGICKLPRHKTHRRIDVLFTEEDTFPFALLYFTGSKEFNVNMRNVALSKGYSLNEYGLTNLKTKERVSNIKSEKDIFDFLEMPWVDPKDR